MVSPDYEKVKKDAVATTNMGVFLSFYLLLLSFNHNRGWGWGWGGVGGLSRKGGGCHIMLRFSEDSLWCNIGKKY